MRNYFKIATIIFYCLIMMSSTHFAAPLLFIILIGLASENVMGIVQSLSVLLVLISFIVSFINPRRKRDIYLFSVGGVVLLLPLIEQCIWLKKWENEYFFNDTPFAGGIVLFLIFLLTTIYKIYRSENA